MADTPYGDPSWTAQSFVGTGNNLLVETSRGSGGGVNIPGSAFVAKRESGGPYRAEGPLSTASVRATGTAATGYTGKGVMLGWYEAGNTGLIEAYDYAAPGYLPFTVYATSFAAPSATTASAANLYQSASGGVILRSTSSVRFKRDIEDLDPEYADRVLDARPVWYRSKADADNSAWGYYGLLAEELAEIDPRLVHWGFHDDQYEMVEIAPASPAIDAVIEDGVEIEPAVPAMPARYERRVKADEQMQPIGVQYERLSVLLLDIGRRQRDQLASIEARLAALEGA